LAHEGEQVAEFVSGCRSHGSIQSPGQPGFVGAVAHRLRTFERDRPSRRER
jgi:hypothetical protein